jgi:phage protein D/phage baseplate assembly protein gpV
MTRSRTIPADVNVETVRYKINVDGIELPAALYLIQFKVVHQVNKIGFVRMELFDGRVEEQSWELSNSDNFLPGKEIEIFLGYNNDTESVFKGLITSQRVKVSKSGPLLIVDARHKMYRSTLVKNRNVYSDLRDSEIVEQIFSDYGERIDVENSEISYEQRVQNNITDWEFLLERSHASGALLVLSHSRNKLLKPDFTSDSVLTFLYGANIKGADLEIDGRIQHEKVVFSHWSLDDQDMIALESEQSNTTSGDPDSRNLSERMQNPDQKIIQPGINRQGSEAEIVSQSFLQQAALSRVTGYVECNGVFNEVQPGDWVTIEGMGERFSGKHFVSGVTHNFGRGQTTSTISIGLPEQNFVQGKIHNSLETGVVMELVDPANAERIKIALPAFDNKEVWARLGVPDAGPDRGLIFRPEIGDEVIVAFSGGDPNHPVIIGRLYSPDRSSPYQASGQNPLKGIKTREGMELVFNDQDVSLTVKTPEGNVIIISDKDHHIEIKDEHGNEIKLDQEGISIGSQSDINIKAMGDLKLEAGRSISIKASLETKVEGSAGVKIDSSGVLSINGSLVTIN